VVLVKRGGASDRELAADRRFVRVDADDHAVLYERAR
jgi:hypothetical protein